LSVNRADGVASSFVRASCRGEEKEEERDGQYLSVGLQSTRDVGFLDRMNFSVPARVTKERFNIPVAGLSSDENFDVTLDDMPRLLSCFR
jgi:hypothetical protein